LVYGLKVACGAFSERIHILAQTPPKGVAFGGEKRAS